MLFGKENISPLMQGTGIFSVAVLSIFLLHIAYPTYGLEWDTFATAILFFIAANTLMGIFKTHWKKYLIQSVAVFISMVLALLFITGLISGQYAFNNYEQSAMLMVLIIFFVFVNLLAIIYRLILSWLKHIDQPNN